MVAACYVGVLLIVLFSRFFVDVMYMSGCAFSLVFVWLLGGCLGYCVVVYGYCVLCGLLWLCVVRFWCLPPLVLVFCVCILIWLFVSVILLA